MSSYDIPLSAALLDAQAAVRAFLSGGASDTAAATAFGPGISGAAVASAVSAFDVNGWPKLVLVDEEVLPNANGAYDRPSDTIYLSSDFASLAAYAQVVAVLVEEIGHALDARLNARDAAGDEGEIFARFVLGEPPGESELAALKAENDHGVVSVNDTPIAVEFASNGAAAKVGIVYSATSAARYFGGGQEMAYSQLFMNAQSQASMAGVPYDVLSESDLTNLSTLTQYDALIFPSFVNVQSSQVAAITSTLQAAQQQGIGLIAAGDFMTNNQSGGALGESRMISLFGVQPQAYGRGNLAITANNSHAMMSDYTSGEVIQNYSNGFYGAYRGSTGVTPEVIARQTINGGTVYNAVLATTTGNNAHNVHFSTDEVMADNNLLWQAIDYAVNGGTGVTAGLQLSRNTSVVASRVDMDQAMYPTSDVSPGNRPGIYDKLLPILEDWKADYNYVGSYYVDIGNAPPGQTTNWPVSGEYYRRLLALGNELGSHSYTHPHNVNGLTAAQLQFEFEQSRQVIEARMSQILGQPFVVDGAAVPGNPENLPAALAILQYYDYLSGGYSGIGAGYTGAFGYVNPGMAGLDKVYIAPNVSFDFSLIEFQGLTPAQASAKWQQEWSKLTGHADIPVLVWPWHDYGASEWSYNGTTPSRYTTEMFTTFIDRAYDAGAEFVTLADLAERISSFDDSSLSWSRSGNTVTATVTSADAGKFALDLDNLGTQKIARVTGWYAYDDDSVFLDRNGGTYTIQTGTTADDVTRIISLPMRSELVSLTGNGTNLTFSVIGEGRMVIDLVAPAGRQVSVSGATIVSLATDRLTLDLGANGTHNVSVTLGSTTNQPPTITSNGGGATAAISIAENSTAVTTVVATDPEGQARTYSISGADAARFAINATTGVLAFVAAPDFEAPGDTGSNNVYDVTVSARDPAGLTDTQAIAVTVTNVAGLVLTGDGNNNTLVGGVESDTISGLGGHDRLDGRDGQDTIYGGDGNDALYGNAGHDTLRGEAGYDAAYGGDGNDALYGGTEADDLYGEGGYDALYGGDAADRLFGGTENDDLFGDAGDDRLDGGPGDDVIRAGDGDDTIYVGAGKDTVYGGAGSDILDFSDYGFAMQAIIGLYAWDRYTDARLANFWEVENLRGSPYADYLAGDAWHNRLIGAAGNDMLLGAGGNDALYGDDGHDTLLGETGYDALYGGNGNDALRGGADGDDLYGDMGYDALYGDGGADKLYGGTENDDLDGGAGNDILTGGPGSDVLIGGSGSDRFDFNAISEGRDRIVDFTRGAGNDVLDIRDVLTGSGVTSGNIAQFVRLNVAGSDTLVAVDTNGSTGGANFVELVLLQNVTGLLLNDMVSQGNLVFG